jgi:hypothetical protein
MIADYRPPHFTAETVEIEWGLGVQLREKRAWLVGFRPEDKLAFGGEQVIDFAVLAEETEEQFDEHATRNTRKIVLLEQEGHVLRLLKWDCREFAMRTVFKINLKEGEAKKIIKLTNKSVILLHSAQKQTNEYSLDNGEYIKQPETPLGFLGVPLSPQIPKVATKISNYVPLPPDPSTLATTPLPSLPLLATIFKHHSIDETDFIKKSLLSLPEEQASSALKPIVESLSELLLYRRLRTAFASELIQARIEEGNTLQVEVEKNAYRGTRVDHPSMCPQCGSLKNKIGFKEILLGQQEESSTSSSYTLPNRLHAASIANPGGLWHHKCFDKCLLNKLKSVTSQTSNKN